MKRFQQIAIYVFSRFRDNRNVLMLSEMEKRKFSKILKESFVRLKGKDTQEWQ